MHAHTKHEEHDPKFSQLVRQMNVRDNVKTVDSGSSQESLTYGARMPNLPYQFANSDISFYWNNLLQKGNKLTLTYDNLYMHSFPLYSEALGSESDYVVPTQFSHNLTLSYSLQNGRYNFSVECRNFTNEKLYDNIVNEIVELNLLGIYTIWPESKTTMG